MDEALRVLSFDELPSPKDFQSKIESRNAPAVFHGCFKDTVAFSSWNPSNGGLDYLEGRVGTSVVEAMLSRSAPIFYGDVRGHEMVPLPFSAFITSCKQHLQNLHGGSDINVVLEGHKLVGPSSNESSLGSMDFHQVYLAQVPILSMEHEEMSQLEALREDVQLPSILESKALAAINLWMNNAKSRSSIHYDPHHNLLCVIAGCKKVVLWPPSAGPLLYPMPIYGEASNHSSVDLESPNFSIHPRAKHLLDYSQKVILHAGDALFIPEGWFHQVDSDDLTIAINYWWESNIVCDIPEHMDAYFLRRILRRLVNMEMDHMLHGISIGNRANVKHICGHLTDGEAGNQDAEQLMAKDTQESNQSHGITSKHLEQCALQALHDLVSLVHDGVKIASSSQPDQFKDNATLDTKHEPKKILTATFKVKEDPVANILWALEPLTLRDVFLTMVRNFPRTLEALVIHMLSPVGAEVLTRKFEEMDKKLPKSERDNFYMEFYSVFDDECAAMDVILNRKESFAQQAFRNVLDQYLGVKI